MVKFSKTVVADRNGEHMERKIKQSENARLPMLELVVSIGVFAVISVFLLEMFLAANSLQQKAKDEGKAITKTETIAEMLKSADVAVCPENAVDEIKKICRLQVCHCKDGALAEMIDAIESNIDGKSEI